MLDANADTVRLARIAHLHIGFAPPNASLYLHSHRISLCMYQRCIHRPRRFATVQKRPVHIDWLPRREGLCSYLLHSFISLKD